MKVDLRGNLGSSMEGGSWRTREGSGSRRCKEMQRDSRAFQDSLLVVLVLGTSHGRSYLLERGLKYGPLLWRWFTMV